LKNSPDPEAVDQNSNRPARKPWGFSLVELMLAVLMIAVLAGIAVATFTKTTDAARRMALDGDANMMNKAIQGYRSSGGNLQNVTEPQAVVVKANATEIIDTLHQA